MADVDPRVAGAAVRCLKQTELTEMLKEMDFGRVQMMVINMVMGCFPKNAVFLKPNQLLLR